MTPGAAPDGLFGLASECVLMPEGPLRPGVVWIDAAGGTIVSVSGETERAASRGVVVSLGDRVIAPGFVDVHVHGGAGRQVNGARAEDVEAAVAAIAAFHVRHGTTSLVATTLSDSTERLTETVEGIARAVTGASRSRASPRGARVLGCHLEGPFISPLRAGAQDPSQIRPPDSVELEALLACGEGSVRIVTLAPELEGATSLIAACLDADVVVSLGHSDADYDCARAAFDMGASHVAHLFNTMAPLHRRAPGLAGAALSDEGVSVEVICDLHHLHPAVVSLVAAAAAGRMALVTDASPAAGLPPGRLALGRLDAVLEGTKVTLESDPCTLAGSSLTMDHAVRRAVRDAHVALEDALRAASAVPARVVGGQTGCLDGLLGLGTLAPGAPADLVILDEELDAVATVVAGVRAYDPGSLLL